MSKELDALARQKANVKELRNIKFIDYIQDFTLLEKALKRNEPMKVKLKTHLQDMNDGETIGLCPNCNRFVKDIYKRCPDCGQAIDWSDEE